MELVYHIQGFLAIDWKNIVAKVRTLWYNGEAKGDFRAVRAKIIDIWRKSVHDLGGEKGLERGIFAEYSKNFVRFLPAFAETTHPREGTETTNSIATDLAASETTHPREGTETRTIIEHFALVYVKQLIPARGRKPNLGFTYYPRADETTHPREGTETRHLSCAKAQWVETTHPREGTETYNLPHDEDH